MNRTTGSVGVCLSHGQKNLMLDTRNSIQKNVLLIEIEYRDTRIVNRTLESQVFHCMSFIDELFQ